MNGGVRGGQRRVLPFYVYLSSRLTIFRSFVHLKIQNHFNVFELFMSSYSNKLLGTVFNFSMLRATLQYGKFASAKARCGNGNIAYCNTSRPTALQSGAPNGLFGEFSILGDFPAGWQIFPEQNKHSYGSEKF